MDSKNLPGKEKAAETFREVPLDRTGGSAPAPAEKPAAPGGAAPESPLGDYLRELEQEFQDQEEEGKL
jgi:hypothetical protein